MCRRIRKTLWFIFISFLIIIQTVVPNLAIAADNGFDMFYQDVVTQIKAGESVVYRLNLRVTGIVNDDTKMRKVIITLPGVKEGWTEFDKGTFATVDDKLASMEIEGVRPTLEQNSDGSYLVYDFKNTLKLGSTYSIEIPLKTFNGVNRNGRELHPRAEYWENDRHVDSKAPANKTVVSSQMNVDISKRYDHVPGHQGEQNYTPRFGNEIVWRIRASIPYNKIGQEFINPNEDIVVTDRIQDNMEFVSAEDDVKPQNGVVTWRFKAPSLEEQKQRAQNGEQNLFERDFWVRFRIKKSSKTQDEVKNQATISAKSISNKEERKDSNEVNILVTSTSEPNRPESNSGFIQAYTTGPINGLGHLRIENESGQYNTNPDVKSGELLGFGIFYRVAPTATITYKTNWRGRLYVDKIIANKGEADFELDQNGNPVTAGVEIINGQPVTKYPDYPLEDIYNSGYRNLTIHRMIDNNLKLEYIKIGVPVKWGRTDTGSSKYGEFANIPTTELEYFYIDDKGNKGSSKLRVDYRNVTQEVVNGKTIDWGGGSYLKTMTLDVKELVDLKPGYRLTDYKLHYTPNNSRAIDGSFYVNVYDYYRPREGATGRVVNKTEFEHVSNHNGKKYRRTAVGVYTPYDLDISSMGDRTANIVPDIKYPTSINVSVELEKRDGNVIETGDNILKFVMEGDYPTTANAHPNVTATLLPFGMAVDKIKERRWKYIDADGRVIEESPNQIEVIDNFKGSGRQLVRVRWKNKVLSPRRVLEVRVPVKVKEGTTKQLEIPVYGGVDNTDFTVRDGNKDNNGNKIQDSMDINEKNGTNDKLAIKTAKYIFVNKNSLKIEKSVRGDVDREYYEILQQLGKNPNNQELKEKVRKMDRVRSAYLSLKGTSDEFQYSKFGITSLRGDIEYKLKMTNTSGEKIMKMGFVDFLPGKGDYSIINPNAPRGSNFTPVLTGPIEIPQQWKDKVDVTYSKVFEPQRNMFDGKIDIPGGHIPNVPGLQDANWMSESAINGDWKNVHAFKIDLKPGVEWIEGQNIEIKFTMKAPRDVNITEKVPSNSEQLNNISKTKTAWNTFAVTTNGLLPVEPEKVGVTVLPPMHLKMMKKDQNGNKITAGSADFKVWVDKVEGNNGGFYSNDMKNLNLSSKNPFTFEQKIDDTSTGNVKVTYIITEERAPVGYKKTSNRYTVVMDNSTRTVTLKTIQEGANGKIQYVNKLLFDELDTNYQGDKENSVEIINQIQVLPKTGGYGAIFYILIGGSLIILSRKIKNNKKGEKYNEEI